MATEEPGSLCRAIACDPRHGDVPTARLPVPKHLFNPSRVGTNVRARTRVPIHARMHSGLCLQDQPKFFELQLGLLRTREHQYSLGPVCMH